MRLNEIIESDIHDICKKYRIDYYLVNDDGSIDTEGNVDLEGHDFTKLPLRFRRVNGYFACSNCRNLESLDGAPIFIGRSLYCQECPKLTKLSDVKIVKQSLYCRYTPIENMLYIFKIKHLLQIVTNITEVGAIINKHLAGDRDIMECQEELIEAGFEKYARLK